MELSVIIVSFNASKYLKQCLASVRESSKGIDCEVFVVDNNSCDDSCEMVEKEFPEVNLIKNETNSGFAAANNKAINLSHGRLILTLNPDTLIPSDAFYKCISFMNDHPNAGAVGVRMTDGNGKFLPESKRSVPDLSVAFFKISGLSSLFPRTRQFNKYYLSHLSSYDTSMAEIISGAFMLISREALNKTGPFDEDFFMYGEDIDLSYRLLHSGFNNYYFPGIQITHFKGKCTPKNNYADIRHSYRSMQIYVMKRVREGKFLPAFLIIIPAIYLIKFIALLSRFVTLKFR